MIWIHIGMPKAGSSSLQSYMSNNDDVLRVNNLHYMRSGRDYNDRKFPLPSHNTLAKQMHRNHTSIDQVIFDEYLQEYKCYSDKSCIISGEMFFGHSLKPLYDRILHNISEPVNIVIYLRRFSDYLESDYKQRAKKGRQLESAESYASNALRAAKEDPEYLNFSSMFRGIKIDVPNAIIHPRIFLKDQMKGGDVISDFLNLLGVPLDRITLPVNKSNQSLSRVSSEALGLFSGSEGNISARLHRQMDAALQNSKSKEFSGKGDVLLPEEASQINDILEVTNREVIDEYFPGNARLFPRVEIQPEGYRRGDASELGRFKSAVRELLKIRNDLR